MDKKFIKGSICFTYIEETDSIISYRITGFKNDKIVKLTNVHTGEKIKMTKEEILENYLFLKPDGYIHFNIVTLPDYYNNGKTNYDVVLLMYKSDDLSNAFAVCRQNTAGFHSNMIKVADVDFRGFSVSRNTCPGNVVFEQFMVCNELLKTESVAVYIGDKLDNILECINCKDFDRALDSIWTDFLSTLNNQADVDYVKSIDNYLGYCKSLKELLEFNDFMDDFISAFDILKINTVINCNNSLVDNTTLELLNEEFTSPITSYECIPYDKDIELDRIKLDHKLISDKDYNIYLLIYKLYDSSTITEYTRMTPVDKLNIINKLTNR